MPNLRRGMNARLRLHSVMMSSNKDDRSPRLAWRLTGTGEEKWVLRARLPFRRWHTAEGKRGSCSLAPSTTPWRVPTKTGSPGAIVCWHLPYTFHLFGESSLILLWLTPGSPRDHGSPRSPLKWSGSYLLLKLWSQRWNRCSPRSPLLLWVCAPSKNYSALNLTRHHRLDSALYHPSLLADVGSQFTIGVFKVSPVI